jgi:hypothetical protein
MKKLMHMLFLSCMRATELIEKKIHFKLSFKDKFQLKMHKSMCNACSLYEKQSDVLNEALFCPELLNGEKSDLAQFKVEILNKLYEKPR